MVRVAGRLADGPALPRNTDICQPVTCLAKNATRKSDWIGISGEQSLAKGALSGRQPTSDDPWTAGEREAES